MKYTLVEFTMEMAEEFFRMVTALGIDNDLQAKNALLHKFIKEGKAVRAWTTDRSKEQIVADLKKNYGNVLNVGEAPVEDEQK